VLRAVICRFHTSHNAGRNGLVAILPEFLTTKANHFVFEARASHTRISWTPKRMIWRLFWVINTNINGTKIRYSCWTLFHSFQIDVCTNISIWISNYCTVIFLNVTIDSKADLWLVPRRGCWACPWVVGNLKKISVILANSTNRFQFWKTILSTNKKKISKYSTNDWNNSVTLFSAFCVLGKCTLMRSSDRQFCSRISTSHEPSNVSWSILHGRGAVRKKVKNIRCVWMYVHASLL